MEQVGRYRILGPLGRGAMGVVYLAEDPLLNRQVAIKTVDLGVEDESDREFLRGRLLKDARAAAALAHPGIVSVYDVLQESDMAYLVMEYIPGESLAAVLKKNPHPDAAFTVRVLHQMADALDYTHARGIVHRDIKPANVMIDDRGSAKIMDFGIARIADARTSTPTGVVMGTIQYMAPEQVKGETPTGKADQFALAAVAYEMLTGGTLFGQHSLTTLAYKIVNETPAPVRERNGSVPPAVDAVMTRALSKAPAERYASCGQFVDALERAFAGQTDAADAATMTLVRPPIGAPRRSYLPLAVGGLLAAAAIGGGLWMWHPWNQPRPAAQTAGVPVAQPAVVEPTAAPPVPPPVATVAKPPVVKKGAEEPDAMEETGPPPPRPAAEALEEARKFNQAGQTDAALQSVDRALVLRPRYSQAFLLRAQIRQKLKQWEPAAEDYGKVLQFFPKHGYAAWQRGICLVQLQRDEDALAEFNRAIEAKPELVAAYNQRGQIFMRRKDYPRAIADFSQAIRLAPDAPLGYQLRANARRSSGDIPGAREDMRHFRELKNSPQSP